jgi:hypothetical protein
MLPSNRRSRHVNAVHQTDAVRETADDDQAAVNAMDNLPLFLVSVLLIDIDIQDGLWRRRSLDVFHIFVGQLLNIVISHCVSKRKSQWKQEAKHEDWGPDAFIYTPQTMQR